MYTFTSTPLFFPDSIIGNTLCFETQLFVPFLWQMFKIAILFWILSQRRVSSMVELRPPTKSFEWSKVWILTGAKNSSAFSEIYKVHASIAFNLGCNLQETICHECQRPNFYFEVIRRLKIRRETIGTFKIVGSSCFIMPICS